MVRRRQDDCGAPEGVGLAGPAHGARGGATRAADYGKIRTRNDDIASRRDECTQVQRPCSEAPPTVVAASVKVQIKARLQAKVHHPYFATVKYYITVCNVDSPTGCQIYFTRVNKVLSMEYAHDAEGPRGASVQQVREAGRGKKAHLAGTDSSQPRGAVSDTHTPPGVAAIFTRHRFVQGVKARHL